MNVKRIISSWLLLLASALSPGLAIAAPAYCSLRDPVSTIEALFPESDSYRSSVRSVDTVAQQKIRDELPGGSLHFSEFGSHTLYIVLKDNSPIGFVHARSEASKWGLVEVAWALDLDLNIRDFRFQRCRNRKRKELETFSFRNQFAGLDADGLRELFDSTLKKLNSDKLVIPAGTEALASAVARCGLKTLLVTEYGWASDVAEAQFESNTTEPQGSNLMQLMGVQLADNRSAALRLVGR